MFKLEDEVKSLANFESEEIELRSSIDSVKETSEFDHVKQSNA